MKKIISIFLSLTILISVISCALGITVQAQEENTIGNTGLTYYVDAENGNDKKDGLTPETAWKTIDKVNKTTFEPGSAILLKRGCVCSRLSYNVGVSQLRRARYYHRIGRVKFKECIKWAITIALMAWYGITLQWSKAKYLFIMRKQITRGLWSKNI